MKALSIRQPWTWGIVHAGKRIENRSWCCRYRGPIALHAAKGMTHAEYREFAHFYGDAEVFSAFHDLGLPPLPAFADLPRGGIVGRAEIVDCVTASDSPWFFGRFGIVLDKVEPLPFRPARGALGLFEIEA